MLFSSLKASRLIKTTFNNRLVSGINLPEKNAHQPQTKVWELTKEQLQLLSPDSVSQLGEYKDVEDRLKYVLEIQKGIEACIEDLKEKREEVRYKNAG